MKLQRFNRITIFHFQKVLVSSSRPTWPQLFTRGEAWKALNYSQLLFSSACRPGLSRSRTETRSRSCLYHPLLPTEAVQSRKMDDQHEVQLNSNSDGMAQFSFDILSEPPANGLYKFGSFDDVEDREEYRPGGFHPVLLGDSLPDNGRYVVIHKLGNGGFATVWLCRDVQSKTLVALKILMADESRDDCAELQFLEWLETGEPQSSTHAGLATPIDHFWIEGPNGRHLCLVLPFLGPRVDRIWTKVAEPEKLLPKLAYQATQSLLTLHDRDICHGGKS